MSAMLIIEIFIIGYLLLSVLYWIGIAVFGAYQLWRAGKYGTQYRFGVRSH